MSPKPRKAAALAAQSALADQAKERAHQPIANAKSDARRYYDQMATLSHDQFDAVLKANAAVADGMEAMASEAVGYARQTLTTAGIATKELLEAKTLDRVIEIQAGLAKSGLEALVERTARLSELSVALANGAWEPIGGCVEATLTKLTKPIAA